MLTREEVLRLVRERVHHPAGTKELLQLCRVPKEERATFRRLVKALVKAGAVAVSEDEKKRSTDLRFPGGVTAEVAMARVEKFGKSGAKPQISAGTIHGPSFWCQRRSCLALYHRVC